MKYLAKHFLAFLLALVMTLGMLPGALVAAGAEDIPSQLELDGDIDQVAEIPDDLSQTVDIAPLPEELETLTNARSNARSNANGEGTIDGEPFLDWGSRIETDYNRIDSKNWMAGISGERYLHEINIPYTHDSAMKEADTKWDSSFGSLAGKEGYARTQLLYINEQLEAGVRIFDLRLNNRNLVRDNWYSSSVFRDDGYNLWLCHGKNPLAGVFYGEDDQGHHLTISKVFAWVKDFLEGHPTETVLLNFDLEIFDDDDYDKNRDICISRLKTRMWDLRETNSATGKPFLYTEPGRKMFQPYTHEPLLKDCRGQVVVLYSVDEMRDVIGGMYYEISPIDNLYSVPGSNDVGASEKIKYIKQFYNDNGIPNIQTDSVSHQNYLYMCATNSKANSLPDTFDPTMKPLSIAEEVHKRVFTDNGVFDARNQSGCAVYFGWVKMDGATEKACRYVWEANYPSPHGPQFNYVTITVDPGNAADEHSAAHYADFKKQEWKVLKGTQLTVPEDVYDVQRYASPDKIPCFRHWNMTDSSGTRIVNPGAAITLTEDVTFAPEYGNEGKYTIINVNWQDGDNADGLRPDTLSIVCETYNAGDQPLDLLGQVGGVYYGYVGHFVGDLTGIRPDWTGVRSTADAPQGTDAAGLYRYEVSGEPGNRMTITMIHTPTVNSTMDVSGVIAWNDHDNADGVRPAEVTLHLLANGVSTDRDVTVTAQDGWSWTFEDCPIYENGRKITYSLREDAVPSYYTRIQGLNVLNLHDTQSITRRVKVVWVDNNDESRMRPSSVEVQLFAKPAGADTEANVGSAQISETGGEWDAYITLWGKAFTDETIQYRLEQAAVEGYETSVEWKEEETTVGGILTTDKYYRITNTLLPESKPAALNGVYAIGDTLDFGTGTYIITDDAGTPPQKTRLTGRQTLGYRGQLDNQHYFKVGETEVRVGDTNNSKPWGIMVTGGDGLAENPYTFTALHREPVSYYEASYNSDKKLVTYKQRYCVDYEPVTSYMTELEAGKWYVVDDDVIMQSRLNVQAGGPVHIILKRDKTLETQNNGGSNRVGIELPEGATLCVYQERIGEGGSIDAESDQGAAIGGKGDEGCGTLIVHGGIIRAKSFSDNCSAIGSGSLSNSGGALIVYSGRVYAYAYANSAQVPAIGKGVDVTVYGGGLVAVGSAGSAGIDGGTITTGEGIYVYKGEHPDGDLPTDADLATFENGDYERTQAMTIREGHLHQFFYTSDGDTITATCKKLHETTGNCPLADVGSKISIKLAPPAMTSYGQQGASASASLEGLDAFLAATHESFSEDDIRYYRAAEDGSGYTVGLTSAPTEPGDYKAELKLPGRTTSIEFMGDGASQYERYTTGTVRAAVYYTIDKAPVQITTDPKAAAITYGQTLADSALTGGAASVGGAFQWVSPAVVPTASDSKNTLFSVLFTPDDAKHYEAATCYVPLEVAKADPGMKAPASRSLTYTGEAQALLEAGGARYGTMMYAMGDAAPQTDDGWSLTVPTGTEAIDYKVWYRVFGDANHLDTEALSLTATIDPAQSGGISSPDTLVYTGEPQALVVAGTVEGGTMQYFVGESAPVNEADWSEQIPARADAGVYTIWFRVKGDANHNNSEPQPITATIAKASISPAFSIAGWTYGEAANAPVVLSGNPGGGEESFLYSSARDGDYVAAVPTTAGVWFVKAVIGETANYQGATAGPLSFVIARANISIIADNMDGVYADGIATLTHRIGGNVAQGDDLGIVLSTTATSSSAPGDYPISIQWSENPNYNAIVMDGAYTVKKRSAAIAANAQAIEEGGNIETGVDKVSVTGLAEGHALQSITLTADGAAGNGIASNAAAIRTIAPSDAKIVDAGGNDVTQCYAITYAAGTLIVNEKAEPGPEPEPEPEPGPEPEPEPEPVTPTAKVKISKCTITVKDLTYTGKAVTAKAMKAAVTVKHGKQTLECGTDYSLTYDKALKDVGPAAVTVVGMGKYKGSKEVDFNIIPKGTAFTKLTGGKQSITLKWKNPGNVTGYQIEYSLKKDFKGSEKVNIEKAKTLKATIGALKAKTTYYVRIRTYKTVSKKNYYSAWSKAEAVKTASGKAKNETDVQTIEIDMNAGEALDLKPLLPVDDVELPGALEIDMAG